MHLFGFRPGVLFVVGAFLVLLAVMMYVYEVTRLRKKKAVTESKAKEVAMVVGPSVRRGGEGQDSMA